MIPRRSLPAFLLPFLERSAARAQTTAQAPAENSLDRIRRTKILRIGAVPAQPPYSWKDLATGAWQGFLPEIARDLAATLGARIETVESTWGTGVLDIQSDKVDIFFGLAPTPQRALAVDFTHPLYQNAFALIARPGFTPKTWKELDDPAVRIAIELGTSYDQSIPELCPNATVLRLRTNNEALLTLQSGRADCQIIVVIFALTTLTRNPNMGHLIVPEPVFGATTNAIVAKSPDPAWRAYVDAWIDQRRAAGALRAALIRNLETSGVPATLVPPQLLF